MEHNTMQKQVILDKWMGLRAQTQKCSLIQIQRYNENKRNINKVIKVKDKILRFQVRDAVLFK